MAENSAIGWTDHTFNPWIGCMKVGPGCDHCYAEAMDERRFSKTLGGATKAVPIKHWGAGAPRHRTATSTWRMPLRWNEQAKAAGKPFRVFCASLADVFDNEVPDEWRKDLFDLIEATPNLEWLLVTKRIGNVAKMAYRWGLKGWPENVRLLITVVNQEEANRDIPKLIAIGCRNGISYEPALGPIDFNNIRYTDEDAEIRLDVLTGEVWVENSSSPSAYDVDEMYRLNWVIVGGESDQGGATARLFDAWWARDTVKQCKAAGVPVFVKQLGSAVAFRNSPWELPGRPWQETDTTRNSWSDPAQWPADLRVQEFPA